MANRTISTQSLTPGELFCVRGKLTYGRLAKQVDGEELEKDKQRRAARGMRPIERPYTSATITDAYVPLKDKNNPTLEERYAQESLYTSHANGSHGFNFSAVNRGNRLPWIGVRDPQDPFKVEQIVLPNELASGLDVTLVMRVFQGKPNKGVTLDGVVLNEPPRYFASADPTASLSALGITFVPAATEVPATEAAPMAHEEFPNIFNPAPGVKSAQPEQTPAQTFTQTNPWENAQEPENLFNKPFGSNSGGITYNPQGSSNAPF